MERELYQINKKSLEDANVKSVKELWEKRKEEGFVGIKTTIPLTIERKENKDNLFHAIFSTPTKDRHEEIVRQNFDLKAYKKNPVMLDSHNYSSIENIIARVKRIKSGDVLEGDIEFALDNPRGYLAYKLASGGFLNTSSIGFMPLEFSEDGTEILKSELLEISLVSVPANPEALIEKMNKSIEDAEPKEIVEAAKETEEKESEEPEKMDGTKKEDVEDNATKVDEDIEEKDEEQDEAEVGVPAEKIVKEIKKIEKDRMAIRKNVLKNIARDLAKINDLNYKRKKKNIFKLIRNLLRE